MRDYKLAVAATAMVIAMIGVIAGVMYGVRELSATVTPVRITTPKPGVTCATMVTEGDVAISCWKD